MPTLPGLRIHRPCNHNRLIMQLGRNSRRPVLDKIQTKIAKRARRGSNSKYQPRMNRGQKRHSRKVNILSKAPSIPKRRSIRRVGEGLPCLTIQILGLASRHKSQSHSRGKAQYLAMAAECVRIGTSEEQLQKFTWSKLPKLRSDLSLIQSTRSVRLRQRSSMSSI